MGKMLRMCLNWKVIAALAGVGALVWLVAPNLLAAAVPLLVVAICPLSMVLMMGAMSRRPSSIETDGTVREGPDRLGALVQEREEIDRQIAQLKLSPKPSVVDDAPKSLDER